MGLCQSQEERDLMSKTKAIDRELMQNHMQQQKIVKLLLLGKSIDAVFPCAYALLLCVPTLTHSIDAALRAPISNTITDEFQEPVSVGKAPYSSR